MNRQRLQTIMIGVLALILVAATALFAVSCKHKGDGSSSGSGSGDPSKGYYVTVASQGGLKLEGIGVTLKSGNSNVLASTTDSEGSAYFEVPEGVYDIVLDDIPNGYSTESGAVLKTPANYGTVGITLYSKIIDGAIPEGTRYNLGDVAHDFELSDINGTPVKLSDIFARGINTVVINFWATWCGPCVEEMPYLQTGYEAFGDSLVILAIDPDSTRSNQTPSDIKNFIARQSAPLSFDFYAPLTDLGEINQQTQAVATAFGCAPGTGYSIPQTYVIDRYGVIAFAQVGAFPSYDRVESLFDRFTADDYSQGDIGGGQLPGGDTGEEFIPDIPDIEFPAEGVLEAAANGAGYNFSYEPYTVLDPDYQYAWPWLAGSEGGKNYIYPSNSGYRGSYGIVISRFTGEKDQVLAFDYKCETERDYDYLLVTVDGEQTTMNTISGVVNNWRTAYIYIVPDGKEHTLALLYVKDTDTSEGTNYGYDAVRVSNMRFTTIDEMDGASYGTDLRFAAATGVLTASEALEKGTRYSDYVDVVYNEEYDEYRVGGMDGPILYANLLGITQRDSSVSVYNFALSVGLPYEGVDLSQRIADYANLASYSATGFVPVNSELKDLLDLVNKRIHELTDDADPEVYTPIPEHEKEWLEFCLYFKHYGPGEQPSTPLEGTDFMYAKELDASGLNHKGDEYTLDITNNYINIIPRGYKMSIVPEVSGTYHIYTTGDTDTYGWLFGEAGLGALLAEGDNDTEKTALTGEEENNFSIYYYLEAGEKYFISADTPTYDMQFGKEVILHVDLVAEAEEKYYRWEFAAAGTYTYDESNPNMIFVPDAIDYELASDGYYHEKYADGSLGGIIYVAFEVPSFYFDNGDWLVENLFGFNLAGQTINGKTAKNYRPLVEQKYEMSLDRAKNGLPEKEPLTGADLTGFIEVDAELFEALDMFARRYGWESAYNAWLLLCWHPTYYGSDLNRPDYGYEAYPGY